MFSGSNPFVNLRQQLEHQLNEINDMEKQLAENQRRLLP